jgi:hypothetical protein
MLLLEEAEKLSLPELKVGIIEEIVTSDQLFQLIPFRPVGGKIYSYNRENTISDGEFLDIGEDVPEGAATFTPVDQKLKRLLGDVDVDNFIDETMSDEQSQSGIQVAKKAKGLARKFANNMINGNETTNTKQFSGLIVIGAANAAQVRDEDNKALSFETLDWLIDTNKIDGQKVFVMNSRTRRSYGRLCRALGGTTPPMMSLPGVTGAMMEYRGIPILKCDWVPITQTNTSTGNNACTTIMLLTLDENEGFCGLASARDMGIRIKNLGELEKKDATRYRLKWYAASALHSTLALSSAKGIND